MSLFTHSTNVSPVTEDPIISNNFPTSPINEKVRIHFTSSEKPLSPISRFNANTHQSRSKTLQRLPTVEKETRYSTSMNARKQKIKMQFNQLPNPNSFERPGSSKNIQFGSHYFDKTESFPSINVLPNNFAPSFKDANSTKESCYLPNLKLTSSNNHDLSVQSHLLINSSYFPNHLKQLDNFDFSSLNTTNLLEPSQSYSNEVQANHNSQSQLSNQESLQLPHLYSNNTIIPTNVNNKYDNCSFRKLFPSIKSFRRKLVPTQSFDASSSRHYSDDHLRSLKPQKSFSDLSSPKYNDLNHFNKDTKLKTSHSADTCLHAYSNYNEFLYRNDKISKNCHSSLENSSFLQSNIYHSKFSQHNSEQLDYFPDRNSASIAGKTQCSPSYSADYHCNNQQVFVPIIRSESTPCICSPTLRIGVKRRANEVERPTANFEKMWGSQFDYNDVSSDLSPLQDRKRFSSRSPESIPDESGSESNLGIQDFHNVKSFEFNDCCNEKLDLQSIEEN